MKITFNYNKIGTGSLDLLPALRVITNKSETNIMYRTPGTLRFFKAKKVDVGLHFNFIKWHFYVIFDFYKIVK